MSPVLPNEVLLLVIQALESAVEQRQTRPFTLERVLDLAFGLSKGLRNEPVEITTLKNLRLTNHFLCDVVTPVLFPAVTVTKFDSKQTRQLEMLIDSQYIPRHVRTYRFLPIVILGKPDIPNVAWLSDMVNVDEDYFPSYDGNLRVQTRLPLLYEEQEHIRQTERRGRSPIRRLGEILGKFMGSPSRSSPLLESYYFKAPYAFTNLTTLDVMYPVSDKSPSEVLGPVKEDFSVGFANYLATRPRALNELTIQQLTLTDLDLLTTTLVEDLQAHDLPAYDDDATLNVTRLTIRLWRDELYEHSRSFLWRTHNHPLGGRPLHDLLRTTPNLTYLCLCYDWDAARPGAALTLNGFDPSPLRRLRDLTIANIALPADALLRLAIPAYDDPPPSDDRVIPPAPLTNLFLGPTYLLLPPAPAPQATSPTLSPWASVLAHLAQPAHRPLRASAVHQYLPASARTFQLGYARGWDRQRLAHADVAAFVAWMEECDEKPPRLVDDDAEQWADVELRSQMVWQWGGGGWGEWPDWAW